MDLVVYTFNGNINRHDINYDEWCTLPHGILKIFEKTINGFREIFGCGGYILHEGRIGGIHQTKFSEKSFTLEELIVDPQDNLKFGVAIPDKEWLEFGMITP